jgi:hypothetical protein
MGTAKLCTGPAYEVNAFAFKLAVFVRRGGDFARTNLDVGPDTGSFALTEGKGEGEDENASKPDRLVAVGVLEEVDDSPSLGMNVERGAEGAGRYGGGGALLLLLDANRFWPLTEAKGELERGTAGTGRDGGGGALLALLDANRFWPLTEAKGELVDA